jgi:Uma2 family endonuclease
MEVRMATVTRLLTYEEWLKLPPVEDGTDEVVKGELRFMPPTRYPLAEIIQLLIAAFLPQVDSKQVSILGSNFGLMISREPLTCRSPDLALYWRDKIVIRDGLYYSPPDLIVEIISPSENQKRKNEKIEDYASIGVPEVWVFSPVEKSVEVWRLDGGRLVKVADVGAMLEPIRFPGVRVDPATIWPG